ncbi:hypothetical protein AC16_1644 [Escherichia coli 2-177-06_S3_C2]|nr:hypothetical protein ECSTEC7V_2784 [Escherichia coli STEC_7v]EIG82096.1 hypothetical protein EC12741_1387 [Escherichia coli 1.2741]EMV90469.1 hypothetical protein EC2865200_2654 [Escherichia coli 2865200]EMX02160.1 hypothetical protein EC174750_2452 [Escherichia coli 174750]EYE37212.1 hypothetical protein AB38_2507 [Escherichia coli 1-110-08_S1_C2]KDA57437.1 hypothetical protein AA98_2677 [Escherichia coli 2-011-08_S1_C1]KDX21041.1 hypothetical protein AC45_1376 [Escherichia coli 2-210-07_
MTRTNYVKILMFVTDCFRYSDVEKSKNWTNNFNYHQN